MTNYQDDGRKLLLQKLGDIMRKNDFSYEEILSALHAANQRRCSPMLDEVDVRFIAYNCTNKKVVVIEEAKKDGNSESEKLKKLQKLLNKTNEFLKKIADDYIGKRPFVNSLELKTKEFLRENFNQ